MTPELRNAVYDILVAEVGAPEWKRSEFLRDFPDTVGHWYTRIDRWDEWELAEWVIYARYTTGNVLFISEDPERQELAKRTNARLAELLEEVK